jgi:high affinity Mn2+ porin
MHVLLRVLARGAVEPARRPDDTIGIAGILNNIAGVHQELFNAEGLGILIGDGQLLNRGLEEIFEVYYRRA